MLSSSVGRSLGLTLHTQCFLPSGSPRHSSLPQFSLPSWSCWVMCCCEAWDLHLYINDAGIGEGLLGL